MGKLHIFLLFPQSDEEILLLGEEVALYRDIPKQLTYLKALLRDIEHELFYDSGNITIFCQKASELCKESYLANIRTQLLNLLNKRAIDISKQKLYKPDCSYYQWSDSPLSITIKTDPLFQTATEYSSHQEETAIVSFLHEDPWHRNIMPIIKDAEHYRDLPILCNIPYFNPVHEFAEWLKVKESNRYFCLTDVTKFERTSRIYPESKQRIYKERSTGNYWYYDYFHKDNKEHYEVFNSQGEHLGEADMDGLIDESKRDHTKTIRGII